MADRGFHKKRRAVTRGSITKLGSKITEVDSNGEHPDSIRVAQTLATKLKVLDAEFKIHMLAIIDLTDREEASALEQDALDDHDDIISELTICIQRLISTLMPSPARDLQKSSNRRLARMQEKLDAVEKTICRMDIDDPDAECILEQYTEQILDLKIELKDVRNSLHLVDLDTEDPILHSQYEVQFSDAHWPLRNNNAPSPTLMWPV